MAFVTTDTTVKDSLQLIWIQDNAKERIMPLSLFGELPQPLIDSLDIQNGVPASISTFCWRSTAKTSCLTRESAHQTVV